VLQYFQFCEHVRRPAGAVCHDAMRHLSYTLERELFLSRIKLLMRALLCQVHALTSSRAREGKGSWIQDIVCEYTLYVYTCTCTGVCEPWYRCGVHMCQVAPRACVSVHCLLACERGVGMGRRFLPLRISSMLGEKISFAGILPFMYICGGISVPLSTPLVSWSTRRRKL
jgi:hypothetical protein